MTSHAGLMRYTVPLSLAAVLFPVAAGADKKADEEYRKINPPVPYKLFVAASPSKDGAEKVLKVFDAKNAKKKWRPFYDSWFALVRTREEAEIIVDMVDTGFDQKPGYETVYYITGKLTIVGILRDAPIRGDGTIGLFRGAEEEFDLLNRIVRYMRDSHKHGVQAHGAQPAAAAAVAATPAATSRPTPHTPAPAAAPVPTSAPGQPAAAVAPAVSTAPAVPSPEEAYYVATGEAGAYHYHREGCRLLRLGAKRIRAADLGVRQACSLCKPKAPGETR